MKHSVYSHEPLENVICNVVPVRSPHFLISYAVPESLVSFLSMQIPICYDYLCDSLSFSETFGETAVGAHISDAKKKSLQQHFFNL